MRGIGTRVGLVAGLGLAALVAGVVLAVRSRVTAFGWFAYSPLSDNGYPRLVTGRELVGWGVGAVGLVVLAGVLGYLVGARSGAARASRPGPSDPGTQG